MVNMIEVKKDFIRLLLNKGAMRIADSEESFFTLKSGRKSPYFINIGALTDGESLIGLKKAYSSFILDLLEKEEMPEFDFIFGPAYKGINLACLACEGLAEMGLNVRYLYDRKEEKAYGDKSADQIIVGAGHFKPGGRILIIDDVIVTGTAKLDSLEKLKVLGSHTVSGLVLAVDRQEKMGDAVTIEPYSPVQNLESRGIKTFSILNIHDIFKHVSIDSSTRSHWIDYYNKYGAVKLS